MSDIIGRDKELGLLKKAFDKAINGEGQTIILNGEAGIGKTSMTRKLVQWSSDVGATAIIGHCSYGERAEPYYPFRKALALIGETEALNLEEQTSFDEIFLISKTGLLMNHLSNLEGEAIDEDILSSMLTAVQDFVKDSFGDGEKIEQKGGLGRLEYQNKKVLLEHGHHVFMAAVVSGEEHPVMRKDLQMGLEGLESDFGDIIRDWDGDLEQIEGTSVALQAMTGKKYRVKRDIESMNLDVERLKAFNGILDVVKEKSGKGLAIVLEDVNWADENSLQAIPFLARNIGSSNILLCMTLEGADTDEPGIKRLLDTLGLEMTGQTIALKPLKREGVAQMIKHRLGTDMIPDGLLERLYSGSAGNPLFTTEMMESLIKERILVKKEELWIFRPEEEKSFPLTVQDIVSRQLESLTHERLQMLEFGAVLGMHFGSESISIGTSIPREEIDGILGELAKTDMISFDGEGYVFKHGMVREAVYDGLSPRWKRMLHRSAGSALEFLHEYDIEPVLFRLAYHFARTSDYAKGIEYSIEAGQKAAGNYAPREASSFLESAVELMERSGVDHHEHDEILNMLAGLYNISGEYEKALGSLNSVLDRCPGDMVCASVNKTMGDIRVNMGGYDDAIARYQTAVDFSEKIEDELLLASSYGALGKVYLRKGEYAKSKELQENYLQVSIKMANNKEIAQAHLNLGGVYWHLTDYEKAAAEWNTCLRFMKEAEDELGQAYALNNLGVVNEKLGKFDEALAIYDDCVRIKKKLGDIRGLAMTYNNIGIIKDKKGEFEQAIEMYKKSLEIRLRIADLNGTAYAYLNLGTSSHLFSKPDEALGYFEKYLGIAENIDDSWHISMAHSNIAESLVVLDRLEEALFHCKKAIETSLAGDFKDILAPSYRAMGQISSRKGKPDEAIDHLDKSLQVAEEVGEPGIIGKAHLEIGRVLELRGEKDGAMKEFKTALDIFEKAGMTSLAHKVREML